MTDSTDIETEGFPSNAPEGLTQRRPMRPFGADAAHALMVRDEALRTLSRQECFDRGYLTVKDLDDEELRYGRCRDEGGNIPERGKTRMPQIPQDKFDAMVAEHELRFKERIRQNLDTMLEVMIGVATDDTAEPRDKFEAAKYLFERQAGKTAETINHNIKLAPWEEMMGQLSGIASMPRSEHRRLQIENAQGTGILDVEIEDEEQSGENADPADGVQGEHQEQATTGDPVQPVDVPQGSEGATESPVVPVHKARPSEHSPEYDPASFKGETPEPGEPYYEHVDVPVGPDVLSRPNNSLQRDGLVERADVPDKPELNYGRRADEKRSYAQQTRDAADLAQRRKEAREARNNAKKQRKIARATGVDAIEDDITGATLHPDGKLTFE